MTVSVAIFLCKYENHVAARALVAYEAAGKIEQRLESAEGFGWVIFI